MMKINSRYKVKTPSGYSDFYGINLVNKSKKLKLFFSNGDNLICSSKHKLMKNGLIVFAEDLKIGDYIDAEGKQLSIVDINENVDDLPLFDFVDVEQQSLFFANGVVNHNCDFLTSGNTVIDIELIEFHRQTHKTDPLEKRGPGGNLWVWDYPKNNRPYMVVADVSRGDGSDYSAFHVIDIKSSEQVAEYRDIVDTTTFGRICMTVAIEYNSALLVIENTGLGWATIQTVIDQGYPNLFYMSQDLKYLDTHHQVSNRLNSEDRKMTPGFTTSVKTRPLIISKLTEYVRDNAVSIHSERTLSELDTFIWKNGKPQAMDGYNDDLVMALGVGLWVRDTALELRQRGLDLTKMMLDKVSVSTAADSMPIYTPTTMTSNPWEIRVGNNTEKLDWLL